MTTQVTKTQLKAKALEYFRHIENTGETIVVTDHGQPTIEIRPYQAKKSNVLEKLKGSVQHYDEPLEPTGQDDWESA